MCLQHIAAFVIIAMLYNNKKCEITLLMINDDKKVNYIC